MVIKKKQMEAFEEHALKKFEDEMKEHLANFSPPLYKAIKEEQIRKVIRLGIKNADKYSFTSRGPVRLYLEMMLLFGSFFDTDPQYLWTNSILKNSTAPQMQRADQLWSQVYEYRNQVNGEDDVFTFDALRGIANYAKKQLSISNSDFVGSMERDISIIYPQKNNFTGSEATKALIFEALAASKKYGILTERGKVLSVVLMLAFGHGCFEDPLYPWINETINSERIVDPEFRVKRLESKALTWLEHALSNLDKKVENEFS